MGIQRKFVEIHEDAAFSEEQRSLVKGLGIRGEFGWDELLKSRRVIMISEAGSGKTFECRSQQRERFAAGEHSFYFDLGSLSENPISELMGSKEQIRFDEWLASQSAIATIFLDSIDELKLTRGSMERALKRIERELRGNLQRATFVITTRPVPFDIQKIREHLSFFEFIQCEASAGAFADVAMGVAKINSESRKDGECPPVWRIVSLTPLSEDQIVELAREQGISDPVELIRDIKNRNAEEFSQRPQDLIELCTDWRDCKRIRRHREQLENNVRIKLLPRKEPGEKVQLSHERALDGASRLALAALLTRRLTIRHSSEAGPVFEGVAALDPRKILPDFSEDEISTLLERALFGFASYGRVRFHHQSVVEYLAGSRLLLLSERGLPNRALRRLLFAETYDSRQVIKPTMRPVVAWVAHASPYIFKEAIEREPEVVLDYGDPESLTLEQRCQAVKAYVSRYGLGSWRGMRVSPIQVHRFASKEVSSYITRLWKIGIDNTEVRELLVEVMACAPSQDSADLVFSIAMSTDVSPRERAGAVSAIATLNDPRLSIIISRLKEADSGWDNEQRKWALLTLFSQHATPEEVCSIIGLVEESKRAVGEIGWSLARSIMSDDIEASYIDELRDGLTSMILQGAKWSEQKRRLVTQKPHLIEPLAAACARQAEAGRIDSQLFSSIAVVLKLVKGDSYSRQSVEDLKLITRRLKGKARSMAFWAVDEIYRRFCADTDVSWRWIEATQYGPITLDEGQDLPWILAAISSAEMRLPDRELALEAAIRLAPAETEERRIFLQEIKGGVAGCESLDERINLLFLPRKEDSEIKRMEEEMHQHQEKSRKREGEWRSSWMKFWESVARNPDDAFKPENSEATVWNLWSAMRQSGEQSRSSGWDRRFVELHFNKDVADRLRMALKAIWRRNTPTLRSEREESERNTYLVKWQLGLAAIAAEAEDPAWAGQLSPSEAKLAARYAPIELNGFPFWLASLVSAHPEAVDSVLGAELAYELNEPAVPGWHSSIVQNISQAHPAVVAIFLPRLVGWLGGDQNRVSDGESIDVVSSKLRKVVGILLRHGGDDVRAHILGAARNALGGNLRGGLTSAWLPVLIKLDPAEGIKTLEDGLSAVSPAPMSFAVALLGGLFGDRHSSLALNPNDPAFTPEILLHLVEMAYKHVRTEDDLRREGAYTPGERDHAEHARNALLSALLDARGIDAWHVKLRLAGNPLLSHFRERAERLALETAAQEADCAKMSEADIAVIDRYMDTPVLTKDDVFDLLRDRIDDLEDLLLTDTSQLAMWRKIDEEIVMRRAVARELSLMARGLYVVDQEAVTADEKETDIRIRSSSSAQEGVIELKLGDKDRSARELRDAITEQLVRKYLAPESRRAGIFLVTIAGEKKGWRHPETNVPLDPAGLEDMLQQEAARVMREMGHEIRVGARVLDLRPRLPTEK